MMYDEYVRIQRQHWFNSGQSLHPAANPDIFNVAYYSDKVRRGDYHSRDKINWE